MNMSFVSDAKVQTQYFLRRIESSFSDVKSVDLEDQLLRSKLVLLLVLVVGMQGHDLSVLLSLCRLRNELNEP
ncbi:hypothetical protein O6P43_035063 [Quillaja saponaria]|uniref:Uncharacterized protein n=1 Tax=Quillaja saponaria TaxID=32244 RepID=A0AAD7P4P3_QUISA|nr:hypothetical protein O6P43_035063 [Quillaja saponaria]